MSHSELTKANRELYRALVKAHHDLVESEYPKYSWKYQKENGLSWLEFALDRKRDKQNGRKLTPGDFERFYHSRAWELFVYLPGIGADDFLTGYGGFVHKACFEGEWPTLMKMVPQGSVFSVNLVNKYGKTPLMYAAAVKDPHYLEERDKGLSRKCVEVLIASGQKLNLEAEDNEGRTAFMMAEEAGNQKTLELLRQYKENPELCTAECQKIVFAITPKRKWLESVEEEEETEASSSSEDEEEEEEEVTPPAAKKSKFEDKRY